MDISGPEELIGAWRPESAVEVFDDGEHRDEFGPGPRGYLCYGADGIVSATLGASDRPSLAVGDPQGGSPDDYDRAARRFIASERIAADGRRFHRELVWHRV